MRWHTDCQEWPIRGWFFGKRLHGNHFGSRFGAPVFRAFRAPDLELGPGFPDSHQIAHHTLGTDHRPGRFSFFRTPGVEFVGHKAVFGFVNEVEELEPEDVELARFEMAFEHRVLDAHVGLVDEGSRHGMISVLSGS